jgi:glutathione S-transferase
MIRTMQSAISGRQWVLGEQFSMADVIFGGTLSYMLRFKMLEPLPEFTSYCEHLEQRPARQRANAINAKVAEEHGLGR